MSKAKWIWLGAVALIYAAFWVWYGGNGDPIDPAEGEAMVAEIEQLYGFDTNNLPEGHFVRNMRDMIPNDDGKDFYAVNLENLKETEAGREADRKYVSVVFPKLLERGGHPVFAGSVAGLMMGTYGGQIDRVGVVRYRSLYDQLDMVRDPEFVAGEPYKMASLEHTEVFIVRPTITFLQMRMIVGGLLLLIVIAGLWVIGRLQGRKRDDATT